MAEKLIRLGMVGGGEGAFIGAVHRIAARLDHQYEFVAGALSSDPERAKSSGADLGLDPERCYGDFSQMAQVEAKRDDGIDVVAIVTPNHMHYPVAKAFLEAGIHVICDKPLSLNLDEALSLQEIVKSSGKLFMLTYNYTGYPMVRQARQMIKQGELGDLRVVQVEYVQDWLSEKLEDSGQKQASWRTDPKRSGAGGCIGDIGTHAYNLSSFVSGLKLAELNADLTTFVEGRALDDNVHIMMRFHGGAKGMLWASQVAPGNENALKLRLFGTKGGLEWAQENPNQLWYTPFGEEKRLITRGGAGSGDDAMRMTRTPAGHPEGYLEGFGNLYSEAAIAIRALDNSEEIPDAVLYPTIDDGVSGMRFIEAAVKSSNNNAIWMKP